MCREVFEDMKAMVRLFLIWNPSGISKSKFARICKK